MNRINPHIQVQKYRRASAPAGTTHSPSSRSDMLNGLRCRRRSPCGDGQGTGRNRPRPAGSRSPSIGSSEFAGVDAALAATYMQDHDYFTSLMAQMDGGGREALLSYLKNLPLDDFELRKVPRTAALADQKTRSWRGVDRLVERLAHDGVLPSGRGNLAITTGEERGEGFYYHARKLVSDLKFESSIVIAKTLKGEWGCTTWKSGYERGIEFPPLNELRTAFDRKHGPRNGRKASLTGVW